MITASGEVSTVAGDGAYGIADGTASTANFHKLTGVAISPNDQTLYVISGWNDQSCAPSINRSMPHCTTRGAC